VRERDCAYLDWVQKSSSFSNLARAKAKEPEPKQKSQSFLGFSQLFSEIWLRELGSNQVTYGSAASVTFTVFCPEGKSHGRVEF
jgi:hypothetical protein